MKKLMFLTLCVLCLPSLLNAWVKENKTYAERYKQQQQEIERMKNNKNFELDNETTDPVEMT